MGGTPTKNPKYIEASSNLDLLLGSPLYGQFLLVVVIDPKNNIIDKWSENRKKWFQEDRQMILRLFDSTEVSCMAGSSGSLIFHFNIPFSKENLQKFLHPLQIDFEFTNYFTGFKGSVLLQDITKAYMKDFKAETVIGFIDKESITIQFKYTIVGTPLFDDLKQLEVPYISMKDQQVLLDAALLFGGDRYTSVYFLSPHLYSDNDQKLISQEHIKAWGSLLGRNTIELLMKGYLKEKYFSFEANMRIALEYYKNAAHTKEVEEKVEEVTLDFDDNFFKVKNEKYPAFPTKHYELFAEIEGGIFWEALKVFHEKNRVEIYKSEKIFRKAVEQWNKSNEAFKKYFNECNYCEKFLLASLDTTWLFETVIQPIFKGNNDNYFGLLMFLMKNHQEALWNYMKQYKEKLSFDLIKETHVGRYLQNNLFTPEFKMLPLKHKHCFGCSSSEISSVLSYENRIFCSKIGENKNIVLVAELNNHQSFIATSVFLVTPHLTCTSPVTNLFVLVANEEPDPTSFEKFFGLTLDKYNQGEIPQDEVLVPVAYISLKKLQSCSMDIEVDIIKPIEAKYMVFIFLDAARDDQNMDIGCVGCLGVLEKEVYEKLHSTGFTGDLGRVLMPNVYF